MLKRLAWTTLLAAVGCADGKELLAPDDPLYAAICVDSTIVDDAYVCRSSGTISVTIANPLYEPADTLP